MRLFRIEVTEVAAPSAGHEEPIAAPSSEDVLELEKAWHGLHFLLTGTADGGDGPESFLMSGGAAIGDEGEARGLASSDVRSIANVLERLTPDVIEGRYDASRMERLDVYPRQIWVRPAVGDQPPMEWLLAYYRELRAFVAGAAAAGDAVIVRVS